MPESGPLPASLPRLVNLKHHRELRRRGPWGWGATVLPPGWVYLGGNATQGGWKLRASCWANPRRAPRDGTLEEVLAFYARHVLPAPGIRGSLAHLATFHTWACWCAPTPAGLGVDDPLVCHGQLLLRLLADRR